MADDLLLDSLEEGVGKNLGRLHPLAGMGVMFFGLLLIPNCIGLVAAMSFAALPSQDIHLVRAIARDLETRKNCQRIAEAAVQSEPRPDLRRDDSCRGWFTCPRP
jgi:hypothetical protein